MIRRLIERRRSHGALRSIDLFADCTPDELDAVDRLLTEIQVGSGRTLMREGSPGFDFVVVVDGTAEVVRDGQVVATVGAGSFVGELALIGRAPRTATVRSREPMRLFVLNPSEFARLLEVAPSVKRRILRDARERATALTTPARPPEAARAA